MAYNSSYSTSYSGGSYASVGTATTTGAGSTSSSTTVATQVTTSSPDDSDGLAAVLAGEAVAVGEDTAAIGSISAELADAGQVTMLTGSADMLAASEGENAFTSADTFAEVSDGFEFTFTFTGTSDSSHQGPTGSQATSSSTTQIAAYDIQPGGGVTPVGQSSGGAGDTPVESDIPSAADIDNDDLEGNFALLEFDALALGENTFVAVDGFVLAVEDSLSTVGGEVLLAVD